VKYNRIEKIQIMIRLKYNVFIFTPKKYFTGAKKCALKEKIVSFDGSRKIGSII